MHSIPNYGAVLQAYATVEAIRKISRQSYNGIVIPLLLDYQPVHKKKRYSWKALWQESLSSLHTFVANIIHFDGLRKRKLLRQLHYNAYSFYRNTNAITNEILKADLKSISEDYDALIVGSDQVWNPYGMNDDLSYLLDFYNSKNKFSFSSSFGIVKFPQEYREKYRKFLLDFQKISVRENEGIEIYNSLTGKSNCIRTVDPTLLLTITEYRRIEDERLAKSLDKEYALIYYAKKSDSLFKYADSVIPKNQMIVILGMPGEIPQLITNGERKNIRILHTVTINEFLAIFDHAHTVFTNSFHGIAFSIIYRRSVWIEYNNKYSKSNSRLENIVHLLKLENRIIGSNSQQDINTSINYKMIELILEKEKKKSENYLNDILSMLCK